MSDQPKQREFYSIVGSDDLKELFESVERLQLRGYRCQGGIAIDSSGKSPRYVQAMSAFGFLVPDPPEAAP